MKKYNASNYFYLSNRKQINKNEIEDGATWFNGKWYTNYNVSNEVEIQSRNILSVYVPSTINVNEVNANLNATINKVKKMIGESSQEYKTQGAWKCDNGTIVYEDICILSIKVDEENFNNKLNEFIKIAENLKKELTQEGISIGINDGLMII